jgi:hypothetical protein
MNYGAVVQHSAILVAVKATERRLGLDETSVFGFSRGIMIGGFPSRKYGANNEHDFYRVVSD